MSTMTNSVVRVGAAAASREVHGKRWTPPAQAVRAREGRPDFVERMSATAAQWGGLLLRVCRERGLPLLRHGWAWQREAARRVGERVQRRLPAAIAASRTRQLALEERLTLGPKQHLYLVRCGEARLLVASAGEGALQWMTLSEGKAAQEVPVKPRTAARVQAPAPLAGKTAPRRRTAQKSTAKQGSAQ